jgi:hypothetical protein
VTRDDVNNNNNNNNNNNMPSWEKESWGEQTCLNFKSREGKMSKLKRIPNRLGGRETD